MSSILEAYYNEKDPVRRLKYLKKSIAQGEEPEANAIRQELWDIRYQEKTGEGKDSRADGYMGLWMNMEFEKGGSKRFFGVSSARKNLSKIMKKLRLEEYENKSELHKELLYREYCHTVETYIALSESDKNYNTYLFGLLSMKEESSRSKLKEDVIETGVKLPQEIGMEKEFALLTKAVQEVHARYFGNDEEDEDDI